jgi:hypothetical protein
VDEENRKQAKHSLDSDEEDNAEKIPKLKKNVLNGLNFLLLKNPF